MQTSMAAHAPAVGARAKVNFRLALHAAPDAGADAVWAVPVPAGQARTEGESGSPAGGHLRADGAVGTAVSVKLAGRPSRSYLTNAASVAELLGALDVRTSGLDVVRPAPTTMLWPGMDVEVVRIRRVVETVVVAVPFETLIQYSRDLDDGGLRILQEGRVGRAERTYRVTLRNGGEVSRLVLADRPLLEPRSRIEVRGAARRHLADSGVQRGQASWSHCAGEAFSAAHPSLPEGTEVTVRNVGNGRQITVVINERGPHEARGPVIALCSTAFAAIAPLGQGVLDVRIAW